MSCEISGALARHVRCDWESFYATLLTTFLLSERESARRESEAAALADLGITPSEASLFNVIHYGLTVPAAGLCKRAAGPNYSLGGQVTIEENHTALDQCVAKGWLRIVDEAVLNKLRAVMRSEGLLGPIYDYPLIGGIDFTQVGAEHWLRICDRLWGGVHARPFAFCDVVHAKCARFFQNRASALTETDRLTDQGDRVGEPYTIGPWRANWWRRFSEGYRVDVEWRDRWTGLGGSSEPHLYLPPLQLGERLTHAIDVLNRHNVTLAEWFAMASLERHHYPRNIVRMMVNTARRLDLDLTEAACNGGLETCLAHGWIRHCDEQHMLEVEQLLNTDTASVIVPFDITDYDRSELDFSLEGACLYRMVSAEVFGQDWEAELFVESPCYREEHRYCANQADVDSVRMEYSAPNETPTSWRTVSIGPWCVYWWKRFTSGYRIVDLR